MRTSNKILIGLLIVIFSVPFLVATTLKRKLQKGEYTVEKVNSEPSTHHRSGTFTAYKVVKVMAPNPGLLSCHLKLSDKMSYDYFTDNSKDSITVSTSNDTLIVKYLAAPGKGQINDHNHFVVRLSLPAINNIVADGAAVIIDSLPASLDNLSVSLRNNGTIKDGSKNMDEDVSSRSEVGVRKHEDIIAAAIVESKSGEDAREKQAETKDINIEMLNIRDMLTYRVFCSL